MGNMKRWDGGLAAYGKQVIDEEQIDFWNMKEAENGDIYYQPHDDSGRWMVWCPAENLRKHLRHLEALRAR